MRYGAGEVVVGDRGRIAIRAGAAASVQQVIDVVREHWAGSAEIEPTGVGSDPLALQQGRTDRLGLVVRQQPGGWITVADSEDATADAALADHLAEALGVPVLWATSAPSAVAARATWFGSDLVEPDEALGTEALERWLDGHIPAWREGWAELGGTRVAFGPVDGDLYVDDSAWLTAAAAQAGAIQVRVKAGVDPEAVIREVDAYWLDCGATVVEALELPPGPCSVVTGERHRLVVAISPVIDGWITVVDSEREVADLGLADWLAATLDADVAWYWIDSEEDTAAIRLFGFEELTEEPADDPESVFAFASATFPLAFIPIDAVDDSWTRRGFDGVDADQYVTDPAWLDEQLEDDARA